MSETLIGEYKTRKGEFIWRLYQDGNAWHLDQDTEDAYVLDGYGKKEARLLAEILDRFAESGSLRRAAGRYGRLLSAIKSPYRGEGTKHFWTCGEFLLGRRSMLLAIGWKDTSELGTGYITLTRGAAKKFSEWLWDMSYGMGEG